MHLVFCIVFIIDTNETFNAVIVYSWAAEFHKMLIFNTAQFMKGILYVMYK